MLKLQRIIETSLYVDDIERAKRFYRDIFELPPLLDAPTLCAFDVGGESVLLIFKRGAAAKTQVLPVSAGMSSGEIPPHDGAGPLHICFAVAADQLSDWERRLGERGIAIEGRMHWARGGDSIYFRDPDNHLLELMTPGNWPIH